MLATLILQSVSNKLCESPSFSCSNTRFILPKHLILLLQQDLLAGSGPLPQRQWHPEVQVSWPDQVFPPEQFVCSCLVSGFIQINLIGSNSHFSISLPGNTWSCRSQVTTAVQATAPPVGSDVKGKNTNCRPWDQLLVISPAEEVMFGWLVDCLSVGLGNKSVKLINWSLRFRTTYKNMKLIFS